jgi:hypothetical protein
MEVHFGVKKKYIQGTQLKVSIFFSEERNNFCFTSIQLRVVSGTLFLHKINVRVQK